MSYKVILKEAIWTDSFSHEPHFKSIEDRVVLYSDVNPRGDDECSVGLNGESYYIKKINY